MSGNLVVHKLSTGYGSKIIGKDIELTFEPGQMYAILGLNGSGKTTLFKTLLGLIPPKSGECLYQSSSLLKLPPKQRAQVLSYVPQKHSEPAGVTGLEIVVMGFSPKMPLLSPYTKKQYAAARQCMQKLEIGHLAEQEFGTMSAGQQQMVILCRALVQDTPVVMLDEPDSSLDFSHKHQVLSHVRRLSKEQNKITILTLHDPNFALEYCDTLLLLSDGKFLMISASSACAQLEAALQTVYGKVALLPVNGHYHMVQKVE